MNVVGQVHNHGKFSIIVASTEDMGIGKNGGLPWHIRQDLIFFKNLTTEGHNYNICIMGRNTWESIPKKYRPLSNRINIIVSRTMMCDNTDNVKICRSFNEALDWSETNHPYSRIFCIGGAQLYNEALDNNNLVYIYRTIVKPLIPIELDVFMNPIPSRFKRIDNYGNHDSGRCISENGDLEFEFEVYKLESI